MGMDFSSFIKPYMQTVYLLDNTEGSWEGGIWVPGEEIREPFSAAINVFSDDQLVFGEAGTFTQMTASYLLTRSLNGARR